MKNEIKMYEIVEYQIEERASMMDFRRVSGSRGEKSSR